jgi:hypothetical protein
MAPKWFEAFQVILAKNRWFIRVFPAKYSGNPPWTSLARCPLPMMKM